MAKEKRAGNIIEKPATEAQMNECLKVLKQILEEIQNSTISVAFNEKLMSLTHEYMDQKAREIGYK